MAGPGTLLSCPQLLPAHNMYSSSRRERQSFGIRSALKNFSPSVPWPRGFGSVSSDVGLLEMTLLKTSSIGSDEFIRYLLNWAWVHQCHQIHFLLIWDWVHQWVYPLFTYLSLSTSVAFSDIKEVEQNILFFYLPLRLLVFPPGPIVWASPFCSCVCPSDKLIQMV